jgi:hypothetical protein
MSGSPSQIYDLGSAFGRIFVWVWRKDKDEAMLLLQICSDQSKMPKKLRVRIAWLASMTSFGRCLYACRRTLATT